MRKSYHGEGIEVTFDAKRCLHAAECVRGLPEVFDVKKKPWIDPAKAHADAVAEVVRRCPSGALHYELADGPPEEPDRPTTERRDPQGPRWVRGDLELEGAAEDGGTLTETRAAICTCDASENKPFCDHSGPCKG